MVKFFGKKTVLTDISDGTSYRATDSYFIFLFMGTIDISINGIVSFNELAKNCNIGHNIIKENSMKTSEKFDVIIIGYGAAGVSAAIEARDHGATVLVLDRSYGGGASALSGGVVYAGGGTPYQVAAGLEDTPENMFNYLHQEVKGVVSDAVLKIFCQDSVQNIAWLEKQGARFKASLCPYKTSYPTDAYYLYYSGNEKSWPYKLQATPAARGHRQVAKGMNSGAVLYKA